MALISPDSIRRSPDSFNLGDQATAVLDWCCVETMIDAADRVSDHLKVGFREDGSVYGVGPGDTDASKVEYSPDDSEVQRSDEEQAVSVYSLDYLKDLRDGLEDVETEDFSLSLSDEYPIQIDFILSGSGAIIEYGQAPRIKSGGEDDGW
jgi:hypothetical protein